jgi:hypothetical protein
MLQQLVVFVFLLVQQMKMMQLVEVLIVEQELVQNQVTLVIHYNHMDDLYV